MEFDLRPYPTRPAVNHPPHFDNRDIATSAPLTAQLGPRSWPLGDPAVGLRTRCTSSRAEAEPESTASSRKRIAVACARCRKRKIRCSGDPGNGSGCSNCKQAGVDAETCKFFRVGSGDASILLSTPSLYHNFVGPDGSIFQTSYTDPMYLRPVPQPINTRDHAVPYWTIPDSEETSPVEGYNVDQAHTLAPGTPTVPLAYGEGYRYHHPRRSPLQHGHVAHAGSDPSITFAAEGIPYLQTAGLHAVAAAAEISSPLNMTSIHSALPMTLPERPRTVQAAVSVATQRYLPPPQPRPATLRNTVDMLQDQRLRSSQAMPTSMPLGIATPHASSFRVDRSSRIKAGSDAQASLSPSTPLTRLQTVAGIDNGSNETSIHAQDYLPLATASTEGETSSTISHPELNFSTPCMLESMSSPFASNSAYSNFRNYDLPESSSPTSSSVPAQAGVSLQSPLYSFSSDRAVRKTAAHGKSDIAALASGHRYIPLPDQPTLSHANQDASAYNTKQASARRLAASHSHSSL